MAAVLVGAVLFTVSGPTAGPSSALALEGLEIGEEIRNTFFEISKKAEKHRQSIGWEIPPVSLEMAYGEFIGAYKGLIDDADFQDSLRSYVLYASEPMRNKSREYVLSQNWQSGFLVEMDKAEQWLKEISESTPEFIYRQSIKYRKKGIPFVANRMINIALSIGLMEKEMKPYERPEFQYKILYGGLDFIIYGAFTAFQYSHDEKQLNLTTGMLRQLTFLKPSSFLPSQREIAEKLGLEASFIALMGDAIFWRKSLENQDAKSLHVLSREIRKIPTAVLKVNQMNANKLLELAWEKGRLEAGFELAQWQMKNKIVLGWTHDMSKVADQGYLPAQLALANAYLKGNEVNRDNAKAYYWFHRAKEIGADVGGHLDNLKKRLTEKESSWVEYWIKDKRPPY